MKLSFTLALFLGLTSGIRIGHHSHHRHQHHKNHQKLSQYKGDTDAWVDNCDPDRDVTALTSPSGAGTGGSYPGVGVECQGFAQKKKHSLVQKRSRDGSDDAWVDPCDPHRDVTAATSPGGAGTGGSYPGVGIECQGFSQKKKHSLAQYKGDTDAWIDDCSPDRDLTDATYGSGTQGAPGANSAGSFDHVGVECQGFAQKKSKSLAQYKGDTDAWIDDCSPDRDLTDATYGSGTQGAPGATTSGSFTGVGVECQGFAQKKSKSLAQYKGDTDAWVDDCSPDRDLTDATYGSGTQGAPGATASGSYTGVGVECQGFAQKKSKSLAQYKGDTDAWIDDCSPDRDLSDATYGSGTQGSPNALPSGSYTGVGVECQGFAQKKRHSLAQKKRHSLAQYKGDTDAWIDDCDPDRDYTAEKNPSGMGTYETTNNGSFPGVGVECQGFAQRKAIHNLAQYKGDSDAWIDDCDPDRDYSAEKNPSGMGTYEQGNGGSFPGVGVECQGFAQRKSRDGSDDAWVDPCDPNRDVTAATSPGGAGTGGSYPGVGIECQGFSQKKKHSLAQYKGDTDAWIDDCDPDRDYSAEKNPSGMGTYEETHGGSFPGVGVECQGFAQTKKSHKHKNRKHHFLRKHSRDCPDDMPDCNGTNGTPGTDCCDE